MRRWRLLLGAVPVLAALAAGWLLATPEGGWAACAWAFRRGVPGAEARAASLQGSLLTGLSMSGLELTGLPGVPGGSARARLLVIRLRPRDPLRPALVVHDARLRLPESGPLHLSGRLTEGKPHFNLYAPVLDLEEAVGPFLSERDRGRVSGELREVDLTVTGEWDAPQMTGSFRVERFRFVGLRLRESPVALALRADLRRRPARLYGEALFRRGHLEFKRSSAELQPSRLIFTGDPKLPTYDLHGTSQVEKIRIRATLKGNYHRPDLRLSSDPPVPQEHLLLTLVTGKRWKGMEGRAQGGQLPLDLVADFIDYSVFGGTGGRLAQRLGVEGSFVLTEDGRTRGLGVRKEIAPGFGLRYGVEETQPDYQGQLPVTRQKVGAEVDVTATDQISLEAEQPVGQPQVLGSEEPVAEEQPESKVLLKYKKRF